MIDYQQLGWELETIGELDHRLLKAPHVKLRSATPGKKGDMVYCVDLRINRPNAGDYLSTTELHSVEHFLLEGFRRCLPANFLSVGIMGCQTGFYLVLLNEGHMQTICKTYENILHGILAATKVPYASIQECGNYQNHSLELAQHLARKVLDAQANWLKVV